MIKIISPVFYLIILLLLTVTDASSQWEEDFRLTNSPDTSLVTYAGSKSIAYSGGVLHVVFYDKRDGNMEIYYKRSTDDGMNWSTDTRLTYDPAISNLAAICVSGAFIHIVWRDYRDGNTEVYYKRSTNAGLDWSDDYRLTNDTSDSQLLTVSASGQFVHVVWRDSRNTDWELYYKHSSDNGNTWSQDTRLTNYPGNSYNPSVTSFGTNVHVAWSDDRLGSIEIFYKHSTDNGLTWSNDKNLTVMDNFETTMPSISANGNNVHVAFYDLRLGSGNTEIYYARSTDNGNNWSGETRITNAQYASSNASVISSGQKVHLVWSDYREYNYEIFYNYSTDAGLNWHQDLQLTDNAFASLRPSICTGDSSVHVIWYDSRDGNTEIYYKRNPTGNTVSVEIISEKVPSDFYLYQNFPNPFNPTTTIRFKIPSPEKYGFSRGVGMVRLSIFDLLGREVAVLVNENLKPGSYSVKWDASNFPSGIYFYSLVSESYNNTKKMVLIK